MRSALLTAFLAATLFAGASASAQEDRALALWKAQERAEFAMYALSDRYSAIWATLERAARTEFSARERAWLNAGRSDEQRQCARERGQEDSSLMQATCLAEVTERRLAALGGGLPALQVTHRPSAASAR